MARSKFNFEKRQKARQQKQLEKAARKKKEAKLRKAGMDWRTPQVEGTDHAGGEADAQPVAGLSGASNSKPSAASGTCG